MGMDDGFGVLAGFGHFPGKVGLDVLGVAVYGLDISASLSGYGTKNITYIFPLSGKYQGEYGC